MHQLTCSSSWSFEHSLHIHFNIEIFILEIIQQHYSVLRLSFHSFPPFYVYFKSSLYLIMNISHESYRSTLPSRTWGI